jgi:hypothetical protein
MSVRAKSSPGDPFYFQTPCPYYEKNVPQPDKNSSKRIFLRPPPLAGLFVCPFVPLRGGLVASFFLRVFFFSSSSFLDLVVYVEIKVDESLFHIARSHLAH